MLYIETLLVIKAATV